MAVAAAYARQLNVLHSLGVAGRRFHDAPPLSMHNQVLRT